MKKIVILSNVSNALDFRRELIRELTNRYSVIIVCEDERYIQPYLDMGCKHIRSNSSQHGTNPIQEIRTMRNYKKIIEEINPDLVITYTIKPNIYGGIACASLKCPYIANITGLSEAIVRGGLFSRTLLFLYRYALRKANKVIFQNRYTLEMFKNNKIVNDAIIVPGSGVNLREHPYEEYPQEKEEIVFLTMGRIMKAKGIDELLGAAAEIKTKYPKVKFVLLGSIYEGYDSKVKQSVNEGIVEFKGQHVDVNPFIAKSHATIHPSYHEGMSNTLLESAATGRPVLASIIPGCKETFDEGISGIGFEPKNEKDLVRAIEKFIQLPYSDKVKMGIAGRRKMEREFDRKVVTQIHLDTIESIIGG